MSKETNFLIYCLETYKSAKKLDGKAVINLFIKYSLIDYIRSYYEALHTTGDKYIINDIDLYIDARKAI